MRTDIIIPCWNHVAETRECLLSVCKNTRTWFRLILVDDGSTDQTPALFRELQAYQKDAVVITHPENLGFTASINDALNYVVSDYVCILNNDTRVPESWLLAMIDTVESHPNVGMVVPLQRWPVGRASIWFNNGKTWEEEVKYATMACSLHPARVFKELGQLDPAIDRDGSTDCDFTIRLRNAGYRIFVNRQVYIEHTKATTLKDTRRWQTGEYQKENFQEFTKLRAKWGDDVIDDVIGSMNAVKEGV